MSYGSGSHAYSSDFNCQMRTPLDPAVPVRGSFRMLRVEPEPELLIVALRSQTRSGRRSRAGPGKRCGARFAIELPGAFIERCS